MNNYTNGWLTYSRISSNSVSTCISTQEQSQLSIKQGKEEYLLFFFKSGFPCFSLPIDVKTQW